MEKEAKSSLANEITATVLSRFLLKVIINGAAVTILIFSMLYASSADLLLSLGFIILVFGITLFRAYRQKKEQLSDAFIFRNFDREFAEMENSSHLLIKDYGELNDLERLQYDKLQNLVGSIVDRFQPGIRIRRALYFLAFSLITCAVIILYSITSSDKKNKNSSSYQSETVNLDSVINNQVTYPDPDEMSIIISPPGYTRINSEKLVVGDLDVIENSIVKFNVAFPEPVDGVSLYLNDEEVALKKVKDAYTLTVKIAKASIYQIKYNFRDSTILASSLHQIRVRPDESPEIYVSGLESYKILEEAYGNPQFIINIEDDFGISDSYIVATITKGEGESVKFREENIPLTQALKQSQTSYKGKQEIDLSALGMEPGDELYFYVHASDNKRPGSNISRSQTFFIVLPDSERDVITMSAGMGVDLMPEYFRSQRQIIIDTEKLISERGEITKKEFDSRSNELGYDQKQLRLRYGQFMGEEFETEIGGSLSEPDHDHGQENEVVDDEQSILEQYGHAHDTENTEDRGVLDTDDHDHDHGEESEMGDAESILEELSHSHDSEENATLFFESSKVKLRAALSLMWTSELHLRLSEPETALPVEYEILKLLKEVQQMSRIYVQRIGFDPPPIKEYEKRLTGEIEDISSYKNVTDKKELMVFDHTRNYISYLDKVLIDEMESYALDNSPLKEVKKEISFQIQENPLQYFRLIEIFQLIETGKPVLISDVFYLQEVLTDIIGNSRINELNQNNNLNPLNELFLKEITNSNP